MSTTRTAVSDTADTHTTSAVIMTHREILEVLTGLLTALFTALLSSTIVLVALPTIIADLDGAPTQLAWIITTSLLATAASTPIWGKLADLFDKKPLLQTAIAILVTGSVLAGCAPTVPTLLAARALQGIGIGGVIALVVAVIGSIIPPREQGRYEGHAGAVMAVSMSGGPLLGGIIVDSPLGWRTCFLICAPIAVVAMLLLQRTLHIVTERTHPVTIDWAGATLLTGAVSILLIWVTFAGKAGHHPWWSWPSAAYIAAGVGLLAATVAVEATAADPIIPLTIITERTTGLAIIASITVGVGLYGVITFLGQYFQTARGYSPTAAGLLTIPMVLAIPVASALSGRLITRFGKWKQFLVGGALLQLAGFAPLAFLDHRTALWQIGVHTAIVGLGAGMLVQNLMLAVQNTVDVRHVGAASSSVMFFRTLAGAVGVSVLGSILATRTTSLSADRLFRLGVATRTPGGDQNVDPSVLPAPVTDIIRTAYGDATGLLFLIMAGFALLTVVAVLLIPNRPLRTTLDPAVDETAAPRSTTA